ncbi:hypothetical protein Fmac_014192 [Flemingia macrophylla]|uniref:Uncharacterized protein n=1 Tax=Flemingia macrophylla TaxID=520843 RepID=A0ABD1MB09_9FABA
MEHHHQSLPEYEYRSVVHSVPTQSRLTENSDVAVTDIHIDYSGVRTHPCPPDHPCPPPDHPSITSRRPVRWSASMREGRSFLLQAVNPTIVDTSFAKHDDPQGWKACRGGGLGGK